MIDWGLTKRKICIFIPNFGRGKYIRATLDQFQTSLNRDDYLIVIGNDGIDEDFSDLADKNIVSFTLNREDKSARNGCFIRNYFIKNAQCDIIFQKDPETIMLTRHYDWLQTLSMMEENMIYRVGISHSFEQYPTNMILSGHDPLLWIDKQEQIDHQKYYKLHHGFGIHLKTLQNIHGYDEEYRYYGPEDRDLWGRLINIPNMRVFVDMQVCIAHLYHSFDPFALTDKHKDMEEVFSRKIPTEIVRNGDNWGNG